MIMMMIVLVIFYVELITASLHSHQLQTAAMNPLQVRKDLRGGSGVKNWRFEAILRTKLGQQGERGWSKFTKNERILFIDGVFSKAVTFQTLEFFLAWIIGLCI